MMTIIAVFSVIWLTIFFMFLWTYFFFFFFFSQFIRCCLNADCICSEILGYSWQICAPLQFLVFLPEKNLLVYQLVFVILINGSKSDKLRKTDSSMKSGYLLTWLTQPGVSSHCHIALYFKSHWPFSSIRFLFCLIRETILRENKTCVHSGLL